MNSYKNKPSTEVNCINCGEPVTGKYCPNCGTPKETKRIDRKFLSSTFLDAFNLDKGYLYTFYGLLVRPSTTLKNYLYGNRKKITNPFSFAVLSFLIISAHNYFLNSQFNLTSIEDLEYLLLNTNHATKIDDWFQRHKIYLVFVNSIFMSIWLRVFFRKHGYNIYETFILYVYTFCTATIIFLIVSTPTLFLELPWLNNLSSGIGIIYTSWALGGFYKNKFLSFFLVFLIFIFSTYSYYLFIYLLGLIF